MPVPTGLGGTLSGLGAKMSSSHSEPLVAVPTSPRGAITVDTELTGLSFGVSAPTKNKNSHHDLVIDFSHIMSLHTGCVCVHFETSG